MITRARFQILMRILGLNVRIKSTHDPAKFLARICEAITESHSTAWINPRHIAEVYHLVDGYKPIFVDRDPFGSTDFTITSWADLDFYGIDFGARLGRPEFVRIPYMEASGVGLVLPRKRSVHGGRRYLKSGSCCTGTIWIFWIKSGICDNPRIISNPTSIWAPNNQTINDITLIILGLQPPGMISGTSSFVGFFFRDLRRCVIFISIRFRPRSHVWMCLPVNICYDHDCIYLFEFNFIIETGDTWNCISLCAIPVNDSSNRM